MAAFTSAIVDMSSVACSAVCSLAATLTGKATSTQDTHNAMVFIVMTALCLLAPMDMNQLIFAILGAVVYYVSQRMQRSETKGKQKAKEMPASGNYGTNSYLKNKSASPRLPREYERTPLAAPHAALRQARPTTTEASFARTRPSAHSPGSDSKSQWPELKKSVGACPVSAPRFQGVGLEAEVQELLQQIVPTAESELAVNRLAQAIKYLLSSTLPEAEVLGFASADVSRGKAFAVAVPDVDIVINVDPIALAKRLAVRSAKGNGKGNDTDLRKLQKSAIRICTDKLVSAGGFKFRRSAFRGDEPKVTLLAPLELGIFPDAVALDLSVDSVAPLQSAALITECGHIDLRAKELIGLVRRWAKDRGICHNPKGHFSPHMWGLLAIYFLQVASDENPVLPPLEEFKAISGLLEGQSHTAAQQQKARRTTREEGKMQTSAKLLQSFFRFYAEFDWQQEAVCTRLGKRGSPALTLPIHIIMSEDGSTTVGPSLEDPFKPSVNLGACMTAWSFQRLKEEVLRARELLSQEVSVTKLLEPWTPEAYPEEAGAPDEDAEQ
eukprot:CAMPEP_0115108392 /NCGR_PEP_ID=MMETSP0227-20121206/37976_1 /TAXON_ID=89957 /ORGANISM="Polarella glacialis, Strain CCMP 1383" /LENGTH=552 /DNA_ID=CAMNT_0002506677 /DNA_START=34 /DNA_END=1692 /DNA_ORIENTATION=+